MIYLEKHGAIVRDSEAGDVEFLASTMRKEDREEIWAMSHSTPKESLTHALEKSEMAITVIYKDNIAAMFGIIPVSLLSDRAIVWLLSSDEVPRMGKTFVKYSGPFIKMFLERYLILENWVDSRYKTSLNWLKWCGFTIEEAKPSGAEGLDFNHVVIRRGNGG